MEKLNPFDDENQRSLILENEEKQFSLWPDFSEIPAGWQPIFGPALRADCISWLESHWQDMRPASQRAAS
ncbi:MbtH family protein [Rouxiella badensis]|jgi:MbtH protein|uniref:MbtH family protein n=1 Tax=Rouxiella badensis TaxID=1646377 RepID=A0A1X0WEA7_9GAMM|nr:MbtH family NRPS accessory protein [Rouxiella badensis]MCC3705382.1 MbtH family protein [Rouxiella badensis]MCC3748199.1 MbtH family protein [Rouxiella badensis]ORJ25081.1 MbtH family protein [Rouxiella badensis]WAT05841.1 MbtH family NRPS accessory protein [Rouxiella badensis]WAT08582.1 MbtH family NRPS accessory protein [Rouxiella badensis]